MCKEIIKIVSLDDDVIKIELELTDNIRNILDLLLKQNFILDWYVTDPEIIYEI